MRAYAAILARLEKLEVKEIRKVEQGKDTRGGFAKAFWGILCKRTKLCEDFEE